MGVARSTLWAPDRTGGHFYGRNSMSDLYIFEKTAEIVLSKPKEWLTRVKHLTGIIFCMPAEDHNPQLAHNLGSLVSSSRPQGLLVFV